MEVSPGSLQALYTRYSQVWQGAFMKQAVSWNKFAQLIPSQGETETHVWLDRIPQLRKWVGDRIVQNASLRSFVVTNIAYELTEALDRFKIEDNAINSFEPLVRAMGEQAKKWPDTLFYDSVSGALALGATTVTYDGQPYFSTAHPINIDNVGLGTQSNYDAAGRALTMANYGIVRAKMRAYKGADNLPLKVNPRLLVVPPALETAGIQILKEEWISPTAAVGAAAGSAPSKNPYFGTADLLVVDDLAGQDTTWYLMDTGGPIKPFVFQLRQPARFVALTRPDDPANFSRHEFQYGVEVRGAGSYGPWFYCYSASA